MNKAAKESNQQAEIPPLGLRNYWYPAIARWRLGKKPKAITLLGEKIVLFRDGGKVYALADRCSHRGAPLSMGKCLYPGSGTVSCPYHGWTFDGTTGKLVAKLMEGSDVPLPARCGFWAVPGGQPLGRGVTAGKRTGGRGAPPED